MFLLTYNKVKKGVIVNFWHLTQNQEMNSNQLTGFYMRSTLALNGLNSSDNNQRKKNSKVKLAPKTMSTL